MTDKKEETPQRRTPTQSGRVLDRTIAHDGIGVGVPNFVGWVADWAVGLLRSGGFLLSGKLERPDFYANGPGDRSMGGLAGAEGSMLIGQPLSQALGVGDIRTKTGVKSETGSLNVNVSYDSGTTWEKASLGEGLAHWGGQIVDPTMLLPLVAGAKKLSTLGKVASAADKALDIAGLGTLGLAVGHDMVLRGLILNPNEALDVLKYLQRPDSLKEADDMRRFNQNINFMLKEFHDPINDRNRTTLFGSVKNKNADPSKLYIRSLDPTSETFETVPGEKGKPAVLRDNYMTAAMEINKVVEAARNAIADKKGVGRDYEVVMAGQQFDKRFNDISLRVLQQGEKVALSPSDTMVLQFRMSISRMESSSPDKKETVKLLREQLESGYKAWATTAEGQAAIRVGVQSGAITAIPGDGPVPVANMTFMLQVQQNLLDRSIKATAEAAAPVLKAEKERAERRAPGTNGFGMWN